MKKVLAIVMTVLMLTVAAVGCGNKKESSPQTTGGTSAAAAAGTTKEQAATEGTADAGQKKAGLQYEVKDDGKLVVSIPSNPTTGFEWNYKIKDESILSSGSEAVVMSPDNQKKLGAGGKYEAIFKGGNEGQTTVTFEYSRASGEIGDGYVMNVSVGADHKIKVDAVEQYWYFLNADKNEITVRLASNPTTGYVWSSMVPNDNSIKTLKNEYVEGKHAEGVTGAGGEWIGVFQADQGFSGQTKIILNNGRSFEKKPVETRTLELTVDKGVITGINAQIEKAK